MPKLNRHKYGIKVYLPAVYNPNVCIYSHIGEPPFATYNSRGYLSPDPEYARGRARRLDVGSPRHRDVARTFLECPGLLIWPNVATAVSPLYG